MVQQKTLNASRRAKQFSLLLLWVTFVVTYVWIFHTEPPHDDEYGRWLFFSIVDTAFPWILCSLPLFWIVLSLEMRRNSRRAWITVTWAIIVGCLAWVKLGPAFHSHTPPELRFGLVSDRSWIILNVQDFASDWLFWLLCVLGVLLWTEKTLVSKGLLA